MEVNPLQCIKFSKDTLAHVILSASTALSLDAVTQKTQFKYLYNYLDHAFDEIRKSPFGLCARTMVVEGEYLDQHYLEDYSRYYAKGFQTFSKKCVRIHFFRPLILNQNWSCVSKDETCLSEFFAERSPNPQDNDEKIDEDKGFFKTNNLRHDFAQGDKSDLQKYHDSYLGYIVIRPLPNEYFAKICLRTFPSHNRNYKRIIARELGISFLGAEFRIQTVPMIEQDRVVAACAAASIWTFLSTTPSYSLNNLPALSEITERAQVQGGPAFPTEGLDTKAIIAAMHHSGVQPKIIPYKKTNDNNYLADQLSGFKHTIFAHLTTQAAVLLQIAVFEKISSIDQTGSPPQYSYIGHHLVCVTGYALDNKSQHRVTNPSTAEESAKETGELTYSADRLSHLYLHDDKFGPYTKFELLPKEFHIKLNETSIVKETGFNYDLLRLNKSESPSTTETIFPKEIFKILGTITGLDSLVRSSSDSLKWFFDTVLNIPLKLSSPAEKIRKNISASNIITIDRLIATSGLFIIVDLPALEMSISLRKTTAVKTKLREYLNKFSLCREHNDEFSEDYYYFSTVTEFPESLFTPQAHNLIEQKSAITKNISSFLETNLPKLVWRVRLRTKTNSNKCSLFCDFLFDATAIPHKSNLICITSYTQQAKTFVSQLKESFDKPSAGKTNTSQETPKSFFTDLLNLHSQNQNDNKQTNQDQILTKEEVGYIQTVGQFFLELRQREHITETAKKFGSLNFAQRRMKNNDEKDLTPTIYRTGDMSGEFSTWIAGTGDTFGGDGTEKNDKKLAWIIDEQGAFHCMFETHAMRLKQGHIALAEHKPARLAGEIIYLNDHIHNHRLLINTRSAAFSSNYFYEDLKDNPVELQRLEFILGNVAKLLPGSFKLCEANGSVSFIHADHDLLKENALPKLSKEYKNSVFLVASS